MDSGFQSAGSIFQVLDSRFLFRINLDFGFLVSRIWIPDSNRKVDSGFHKKKFPRFTAFSRLPKSLKTLGTRLAALNVNNTPWGSRSPLPHCEGWGGGGFIVKEPEESRLAPRNMHTRSLPLFRKNRERPMKFSISLQENFIWLITIHPRSSQSCPISRLCFAHARSAGSEQVNTVEKGEGLTL